MRHPRSSGAGLLLAGAALVAPARLHAQAVAPSLPRWSAELRAVAGGAEEPRVSRTAAVPAPFPAPEQRTHTWTGLVVGSLVGVAATGVFLAGFCGDADTECGADEVARAFGLIAVPTAAVGALVGSLVRTKRRPEAGGDPNPAE